MTSNLSYIVPYSNVIPVRGFSRSILMDLYKGKFLFIPNYLCDFLIENKSKNLQKADFLDLGNSIEDFNEITSLLDELLLQDYLIETELEVIELLKVEIPDKTEDALIDDCIIELSDYSNWDVTHFLAEINHIGVKFLEIRFLDFGSFKEKLRVIKSALKDHSIEFLHCIVPFDDELQQIVMEELLDFARLNQLTIYNATSEFEIENAPFLIDFSNQESISSSNCGCIDPQYFSFNVPSYYQNKKYNNCLSHKLSVDQFGEIKNCPSKKNSFGKTGEINLEQTVQLDEFKKEWRITKESVLICSDCEFRWMCSDCRVFIQDESNSLSKPSKCGYNPYINKWINEADYVTELECGVSIIGNQLSIDHEKLNQINANLWT